MQNERGLGTAQQAFWIWILKNPIQKSQVGTKLHCLRRRCFRQLLRKKFSDHFSFARISSALTPLASSFFSTSSASAFFADSAALVSALTFLASILAISLSIDFSSAFLAFRSAFSAYSQCWMRFQQQRLPLQTVFRQSAQQSQRLLLRSWSCSCFLWDGAYGTPPMFFDGFSITRVFYVRKRCSL